ncbi:unknown [Prevotella sp. CAG:1320]|nr:unknown [Prevotella sp. CAG:1320]
MLSYPYHPIVTRRAYFCSEKIKMKRKDEKNETNQQALAS